MTTCFGAALQFEYGKVVLRCVGIFVCDKKQLFINEK